MKKTILAATLIIVFTMTGAGSFYASETEDIYVQEELPQTYSDEDYSVNPEVTEDLAEESVQEFSFAESEITAEDEVVEQDTEESSQENIAVDDKSEEDPAEVVEPTADDTDDNIIAAGNCGDDLSWELTDDGTLTISGSGTMTDPLSWDEYKSLIKTAVVNGADNIGDSAFSGCENLTKITIADSVTDIEEFAFERCKNLTDITIPANVTHIGNQAFVDCESLTDIIIPEKVTSIGVFAFENCINLLHVVLPSSLTDIEDAIFTNCTGLTTAGPEGSGCNIEYGWTSEIPAYAFTGSSLTNIVISESITSIGDWAFTGTSLTDVTISTNLKNIGKWAFTSCLNLVSITIPESVSYIGNYAFRWCGNLGIYSSNGSYAQNYAEENGIKFFAIASGDDNAEENSNDEIPSDNSASEENQESTPDLSDDTAETGNEETVPEIQPDDSQNDSYDNTVDWKPGNDGSLIFRIGTEAAEKIVLTRTLKKGMTGEDVLAVQKRLAELGYLTEEPNGVFDESTEEAVRKFQLANGIIFSNGMVGTWTVTKLNGRPVVSSDLSDNIGSTLVSQLLNRINSIIMSAQ